MSPTIHTHPELLEEVLKLPKGHPARYLYLWSAPPNSIYWGGSEWEVLDTPPKA